MSIFKRIQLSIIRNLKKSLLMIMVSFFLGVFVVTSIYMYQSLNTIDSTVKQQLSPSVLVSAKDQYELDGDIWVDLIDEENSIPIFEKYLNDERVKYGDILFSQYTQVTNPTINSLPLLNGINNQELVDVLNEEYSQIRGRLFTKEEMSNGLNVIVMIENDYNHYEVGDKIQYDFVTYTSYLDENPTIIQSETFEIIGVLEMNKNQIENKTFNFIDASSRAYIPYQTFKTIMNELKDWEIVRASKLTNDSIDYGYDLRVGNIEFDRAVFKLNSAEDLEGFVSSLEKELEEFSIFEIQSDYANYHEVKDSTNRIQKLSIYILVLSILASVVILTIVIYIYVKDRQNEVGLFLALGQNKNTILISYIFEILVLSLIGTFGSFVLGHLIGESLINHLILNQEAFSLYSQLISNNLLSNQYFIITLCVEVVVIAISSTLPLFKTMNVNPKDLFN